MGKSAAQIEAEIFRVVADCGNVGAIGLWFLMNQVIRTNPDPGYLEQDGRPADPAKLTHKLGPRVVDSDVKRWVDTLRGCRLWSHPGKDGEPLIEFREKPKSPGVLYLYSSPMARAAAVRKRVRDGMRGSIEPHAGSIEPSGKKIQQKTVYKSKGVQLNPSPLSSPPDGFPPITPLPYPPLQSPNSGFTREDGEPLFPVEMRTPEFDAAWLEWLSHRKETGHPLKKTGMERQAKTLAAIGVARAIAMIHNSIFNSYQGLFEPSTRKTNERTKRTPAERGHFPEDDVPLPEFNPRPRNSAPGVVGQGAGDGGKAGAAKNEV